jgi:hypothetical protein
VLASSVEVFGWIKPVVDLRDAQPKEQEADHMRKTVEAFKDWWKHQGEPSGKAWDAKEEMLTDRLRHLQIEKYGEESIKP